MRHQYASKPITHSRHPIPVAVAALALSVVFLTGMIGAQHAPNPSRGSADVTRQIPARDVLTHHNDNFRTGTYLMESQLIPERVGGQGMRLKYSRTTNGAVSGQALFVYGLEIDKTPRHVVYAATSSNAVYAFEADEGDQLWSRTLRDPEDDSRSLSNGIFSTPVIDRAANTMYVVYSTRNRNPSEECERPEMDVAYWLTALDIRTGETLRHVKVEGAVLRNNGAIRRFVSRNHWNRPALLLSGGSVYLAFGMRHREECIEYHGWVMRYDAKTLAPQGVFCTTPNIRGTIWSTPTSGGGAGIWQGAGGVTADSEGNIYFITGNGRLDHENQGYGDSIVKLSPTKDDLQYAGSFPPNDPQYYEAWERLRRNDVDLGSGGMMVIPETDQLVGGGKTGIWYLLDRFKMTLVQEIYAFTNQENPSLRDQGWDVGPRLHGSPAYWRGPNPEYAYVYQWSDKDHLKAYRYYFKPGAFDEKNPVMNTQICPNRVVPGGMLSISADGNLKETGIVWVVFPSASSVIRHQCDESEPSQPPNRLMAFHAETLQLLWQTNLPGRSHYVPPTIADGKVFVPAGGRLLVYELEPTPVVSGQRPVGRRPFPVFSYQFPAVSN